MEEQIFLGVTWTLLTTGVAVAFIVSIPELIPGIANIFDSFSRFLRDAGVLLFAVSWLLIGIMAVVVAWASLFWWRGEFSSIEDVLYFSAVSVTTVGYGDIVVTSESRLLAGFAAANGFLVFGLDTAALYDVLVRLRSETQSSTI